MSDPGSLDHSDALSPSTAVWQMATAHWVSQSLHVAARLGIADLLRDGPKRSDELAKATATHPASLYRVLRALASVGVFTEDAAGRFGLTPLGACLQTDA